ncbi:uncharacterized protein L969DRAFT_96514 [Mixia osmundae IAM 14324]|uniref:Mitochondrial genome maintenance protein MGM101 n=1 Tax=Mixia osmundae (strain CBS 9802 / IAM 14324 / JCM 22182 / KY 12970) TaxID=764103 RepID=G7DUT6_MIXOS|nr:uncharacterized protein L969DRAFT_96514 [Mixia osmundae IAM 14324]KEI37436.1 hypothetical protein L969DRAFT_96514 [Mixia osmundae IAM 14324]GAA94346.1 hypothetical protein E5Q_00997 [Mixia osmundae IAM 14324]
MAAPTRGLRWLTTSAGRTVLPTVAPAARPVPLYVRALPGSRRSAASGTAPLSATTGSPGQSIAIDQHPATSSADLTPLPGSSAQLAEISLSEGPGLASSVSHPQDWSTSFSGLSVEPFSAEIANVLLEPLDPEDIEIKPDGLLYLPEIKYRRILNQAFGPGGWGLAPRGETTVTTRTVSREYGLVCLGRLVSVARGEQEFFDPSGVSTATEGCKSNALMRCCKDLGIASELWDPRFIRAFKKANCAEVWAEHAMTKKKRKLWRRKDTRLDYPYSES